MTTIPNDIRIAIESAREKKAEGVALLDLRKLGAFTEYFLICTGFSSPQIAAIADNIEEKLAQSGRRRVRLEGNPKSSEWVLLDFGYFVVHIFTERARLFYDLERLWRAAPRTDFSAPPPGMARAR